MSSHELALEVFAEAHRRYNDGGWDVLVETWTVRELENWWVECSMDPTTVEEALATVENLIAVWADRQADAKNSAF